MQKKKALIVMFVITILLAVVVMIVRIGKPIEEYKSQSIGTNNDTQYIFNKDGDFIQTAFTAEEDNIHAVQLGLQMAEKHEKYVNEKLTIDIIDETSDNVIDRSEVYLKYEKSSASVNGNITVPLACDNIKGKRLIIRATGYGIGESFGLTVDTTGYVYSKSKTSDGVAYEALCGKIKYLSYTKDYVRPIIDFCIFFCVAGICFWTIMKKIKLKPALVKEQVIDTGNQQKFNNTQYKRNKMKYIVRGTTVLAISVAAIACIYIFTISRKTGVNTIVDMSEGGDYVVANSKELAQTFECTSDYFSGIRLLLNSITKPAEDKALQIIIKDEYGNELYNKNRILKELHPYSDEKDSDGKYQKLEDTLEIKLAEPVKKSLGKSFTICIRDTQNDLVKTAFSLGKTIKYYDENGNENTYNMSLVVGGERQIQENLEMQALYKQNRFLINLFRILAVVLLILCMGTYILVDIVKAKPHVVYAFTGCILGGIFCAIISVYGVPDEPVHIDTAYKYSNQLLQIKEPSIPGYIYKRGDDISGNVDSLKETNIETYRNFYTDLLHRVNNDALIKAPAQDASDNANIFMYLPAAIGFAIARLLKLSSMAMLMFGRLMNMFFCILCIAYSIKKIPVGKYVLFLIGMFPMTLQQAASVSYDSILIGLSFVFTACTLDMIVKDEDIRWFEWAVMIFSAAILGSCKGGVYIPLILFVVSVWISKKSKSAFYKTIPIVSIVIVMLMFMRNNASRITAMLTRTGATGGGKGQELYSVSYFLEHPLDLIMIYVKTVRGKLINYLEEMVGSSLGWGNINISLFVVLGFVILLLIALVYNRKNEKGIPTKTIAWGCIVCAASFVLITFSMLIAWTPIGSNYIMGIQGRYFLPLIPLLLGVFGTENKKDRAIDLRKWMIPGGVVMLQIVVIGQILISTLGINN